MPIVGQVLKWFPSVLNSTLIHKKPLKTNIICYRVHYYFVWRMAGYLYYFLTTQGNKITSDVLPKLNFPPVSIYAFCSIYYFLIQFSIIYVFINMVVFPQTIKRYWNSSYSISMTTNYRQCSHIDSPSKSQCTVINHSVVLGYCLSVFHPSKDI